MTLFLFSLYMWPTVGKLPRPYIVTVSSHDKEKKQRFLICIMLSFGVSKLPSQWSNSGKFPITPTIQSESLCPFALSCEL